MGPYEARYDNARDFAEIVISEPRHWREDALGLKSKIRNKKAARAGQDQPHYAMQRLCAAYALVDYGWLQFGVYSQLYQEHWYAHEIVVERHLVRLQLISLEEELYGDAVERHGHHVNERPHVAYNVKLQVVYGVHASAVDYDHQQSYAKVRYRFFPNKIV